MQYACVLSWISKEIKARNTTDEVTSDMAKKRGVSIAIVKGQKKERKKEIEEKNRTNSRNN